LKKSPAVRENTPLVGTTDRSSRAKTPGLPSLGETEGGYSLIVPGVATVAFDRDGRARSLYENGFYYARGMDGRCVEKKWINDRRHARELSPDENTRLRTRLSNIIESVQPFVKNKGLDLLQDFVSNRWETDGERFKSLWPSIGILPPDQYLALVLSVTDGCSWNQCSFCRFYKDRPFRVRSLAEVLQHTDEAIAFWGEGLQSRCSVFLGEANAFQTKPPWLISLVETLKKKLPRLATPQSDGVGGVYAFAEAVSLIHWSVPELKALGQAGFRRAYVGVETGDDALRRTLRKPGTATLVLKGLTKLKEAGINLGLMILLGPGGRSQNSAHVRATVELLKKSPLGPGDFLYFSPLRDTNSKDFSEEDRVRQREQMESALPSRGERRALYDINDFLY